MAWLQGTSFCKARYRVCASFEEFPVERSGPMRWSRPPSPPTPRGDGRWRDEANLRSVPLNLTDVRDVATSCKYAAAWSEARRRGGTRSRCSVATAAFGCARLCPVRAFFARIPSGRAARSSTSFAVVVVVGGRLARRRTGWRHARQRYA